MKYNLDVCLGDVLTCYALTPTVHAKGRIVNVLVYSQCIENQKEFTANGHHLSGVDLEMVRLPKNRQFLDRRYSREKYQQLNRSGIRAYQQQTMGCPLVIIHRRYEVHRIYRKCLAMLIR